MCPVGTASAVSGHPILQLYTPFAEFETLHERHDHAQHQQDDHGLSPGAYPHPHEPCPRSRQNEPTETIALLFHPKGTVFRNIGLAAETKHNLIDLAVGADLRRHELFGGDDHGAGQRVSPMSRNHRAASSSRGRCRASFWGGALRALCAETNSEMSVGRKSSPLSGNIAVAALRGTACWRSCRFQHVCSHAIPVAVCGGRSACCRVFHSMPQVLPAMPLKAGSRTATFSLISPTARRKPVCAASATKRGDADALESFRQSWCLCDWPGPDLIAGDGPRGHSRRPR